MTLTVTYTHVFAEPDSDSVIDCIDPATGRSAIESHTLEQVRERHPRAVVMSWDDWSAQKAARQDTAIQWLPTDAATYDEMLNVLPPAEWTSWGFLVGEAMDHHAGTGRARYQAFRQMSDGTFRQSSRPITVPEFRAIRELGERLT